MPAAGVWHVLSPGIVRLMLNHTKVRNGCIADVTKRATNTLACWWGVLVARYVYMLLQTLPPTPILMSCKQAKKETDVCVPLLLLLYVLYVQRLRVLFEVIFQF